MRAVWRRGHAGAVLHHGAGAPRRHAAAVAQTRYYYIVTSNLRYFNILLNHCIT